MVALGNSCAWSFIAHLDFANSFSHVARPFNQRVFGNEIEVDLQADADAVVRPHAAVGIERVRQTIGKVIPERVQRRHVALEVTRGKSFQRVVGFSTLHGLL